MQCPRCHSSNLRKNGHQSGKQRYQCKDCRRQFVEFYSPQGYSDAVKRQCLNAYVNKMGFRTLERHHGVDHTTVIRWVKQVGQQLPQAPPMESTPEVAQLDELQTFVGFKKNKVWLWTATDKARAGIWAWTLGDRSAQTFRVLWAQVQFWQCFWYVTDGWPVYPKFIKVADHVVSKPHMTRVEGENSRLRHYLARLNRRTFCYSKSIKMLGYSIRLLLHYLHYRTIPIPA
ncbi:IS1 family transposase [Sphaerothrix gracilis]|uniref:IS1 family transposase n=1 Tax=Sphaerothrix gracilis TaxID=3151835 RepID=UPI0031FC8C35